MASREFDFSGRTMLVTGSGRNIGRAIVLEFAGRGANVVINARTNVDEAEAVRAEAVALYQVVLPIPALAMSKLKKVDFMAKKALRVQAQD